MLIKVLQITSNISRPEPLIWVSFINVFTTLGGRGSQGFCDDSTKALISSKKRDNGGRGCIKLLKIACRHLWTTPYAINLDLDSVLLSHSIHFYQLTFLTISGLT